ncbi:MAG TPA: hypothetical protein ENJ82_10405 [Bacteroidetes bacterium]|nr:hypothetical protein [Bacteroidota bacterium]
MANNKDIQRLIENLENGDPTSAENTIKEINADAPHTFSPGFTDQLMDVLATETAEKGMEYFLPRLFRWVVLSGVAAAIALLIMTYVAEDTISLDAIAGLSELSVSDVIALNE